MKVLDIFSGIGGFSLGLERAGFETVAFCEIEEYPNKAQFKRRSLSERIQQKYANTSYPRWGKDKPGVDRMANGIPSQTHRLAALGNAVVPQIPELIGRAIIEYEKDINK